ncbi:hypothetical protein ACUR5C_06600 [Aliikangiella sp. IMCC44653]
MNSQKGFWVLIAVCLSQAWIIIYLTVSFNKLKLSLPQTIENTSDLVSQLPADSNVSALQVTQTTPNFNTADLRVIIQEELEHYFNQHDFNQRDFNQHDFNQHNRPNLTVEQSVKAARISTPEQIQLVDQQLAQVAAEGSFSNQTFEAFSSNVAKLSPQDRRRAFSKLAKMINSGRVEPNN